MGRCNKSFWEGVRRIVCPEEKQGPDVQPFEHEVPVFEQISHSKSLLLLKGNFIKVQSIKTHTLHI